MWVLENPDKTFEETTIAETESDCWYKSFDHVSHFFTMRGFKYSNRWRFDFRELFWKKIEPARKCAMRNGFNIVEVTLQKVPEDK